VEGSGLIAIGKEMYVLRGDGLLMPAKNDQPPPDLRYFVTTQVGLDGSRKTQGFGQV
jgi:hypothetical protein